VTGLEVVSTVTAAIAAVAACVGLWFAWQATQEGRRTIAEAQAARREVERDRRRVQYQRIAEVNEEVSTRAQYVEDDDFSPMLQQDLNKMRALVAGLKDELPETHTVPDQMRPQRDRPCRVHGASGDHRRDLRTLSGADLARTRLQRRRRSACSQAMSRLPRTLPLEVGPGAPRTRPSVPARGPPGPCVHAP
jgi:hypothetical protein